MQAAGYGSSARENSGLAIAAIISITLHALAAWGVYDLPLGHIDPRLLTDETVLPVEMIETGLPILPRHEAEEDVAADVDPADLSVLMLDALPVPPVPLSITSHSPNAFPGVRVAPSSDDMALEMSDAIEWLPYTGSSPKAALALNAGDTDTPRSNASAHPAPPPSSPDTAISMLNAITTRLTPSTASSSVTSYSGRPALGGGTNKIALPDYAESALEATTRLDVPEHLDHDFDYHLTVYHAPRGPDYFRVDITGRRSLSRLHTMAKDVIFLVDTSGSVSQAWVDAATAGIRDALSGLGQRDRFNIVLFDEQPRFFSPQRIRPVDEQALVEARAFLADTQSRGYTDVNHALSRLLVRDVAEDRVYSLVLLSDGKPTRGVMDTRELIEHITRDNDLNAGIYCIGIGASQNRTLLDFLAYRNRGYSLFVQRSSDTATVIRDLVSRIRYPILKQVSLDALGVGVTDVVPQTLPDVHQGQRAVVYGRFDRRSSSELTMRVQGWNHGQAYDFTFQRHLVRAEMGTDQIARGWGFQKLHHLYGEMLHAEDPKRVQKEIEALKRRYRLKSVY